MAVSRVYMDCCARDARPPVTAPCANEPMGHAWLLTVGSGAAVLEVAAALALDVPAHADGRAAVGDAPQEGGDVGGLVAARQAALVALAVRRNVLRVLLGQLLDGLQDDLVACTGRGREKGDGKKALGVRGRAVVANASRPYARGVFRCYLGLEGRATHRRAGAWPRWRSWRGTRSRSSRRGWAWGQMTRTCEARERERGRGERRGTGSAELWPGGGSIGAEAPAPG